MSKRLLDYNPYTQTATYHYYDHATKQTHIETVQDTSAIIESNKRSINSGLNQTKGDYWHFATIPNGVILKLKAEKGIDINNKDDLPKLERLIQRDPEYKYLRRY